MSSIREQITQYALDKDGLITLNEAVALGIPAVELRKLVHRGKLTRIGRGVYRTQYSRFEAKSSFREALALVGPEAFLIGESALAVLDIGVFNPKRYHIATTNRIRKNLPENISLKRVKDISEYDVIEFDHVRFQSSYSVFKEILWFTETERILDAMDDATEKGFLNPRQVLELTQILENREKGKIRKVPLQD